MMERFINLYALPQSLYADGAPVLIASGELFRDTQTDGVFAQFAIRNLCEQTICAAEIAVTPLDAAGKPCGDAVIRPYQDLSVKRGGVFGKIPAVSFPDAYVSGMTASVTRVVFQDGSEWTSDGTPFSPLPASESLDAHFGDGELVKQYRLTYGKAAECFPARYGDLWRCSCGEWNRADFCSACGNTEADLFSFDLFRLIDAKGVRVAKERADAERSAAEKAAFVQTQRARARSRRLAIILVSAFLILLIGGHFLATRVVVPNQTYGKAVALYEAGEYEEANALFLSLGNFRDSRSYLMDYHRRTYGFRTLTAGRDHTFAIRSDGTPVVTDYQGSSEYDHGQDAVTDWTDLVEISTGWDHTVGLRSDGTVAAVGNRRHRQCDVSDWTDIVSVKACDGFTLGLKSDGTVVVTDGTEASTWMNVAAIDGYFYGFGLRTNGTVITERSSGYGVVSGWTDVAAIAAGPYHFVALRTDGTVLATHGTVEYEDEYDFGECDVSRWNGITAIAAGAFHTVGLKADGTVVAVGNNQFGQCDVSDWTDIVAVGAGIYHTVGLKADGTVVAVGMNDSGQCDVSGWTGIRMPDRE